MTALFKRWFFLRGKGQYLIMINKSWLEVHRYGRRHLLSLVCFRSYKWNGERWNGYLGICLTRMFPRTKIKWLSDSSWKILYRPESLIYFNITVLIINWLIDLILEYIVYYSFKFLIKVLLDKVWEENIIDVATFQKR